MLIDSFTSGRDDRIHIEIHDMEQGNYEVRSHLDPAYVQIRSYHSMESAYAFCVGRGWLRGMDRYKKMAKANLHSDD